MHFVTGGAYNGKGKWVRDEYRMEKKGDFWVSAYQGDRLISPFHSITVIEGMESYIKESVNKYGEDAKMLWKEKVKEWIDWEKASDNRRLVLIGCDISKGLVPLEEENRMWRDVTGWVYQDIVRSSDRTDVIWYGISEKLKGG